MLGFNFLIGMLFNGAFKSIKSFFFKNKLPIIIVLICFLTIGLYVWYNVYTKYKITQELSSVKNELSVQVTASELLRNESINLTKSNEVNNSIQNELVISNNKTERNTENIINNKSVAIATVTKDITKNIEAKRKEISILQLDAINEAYINAVKEVVK